MNNIMVLQFVEMYDLSGRQTVTKLDIQNSWRSNCAGIKNTLYDIRVVMSS
jgi:hypothetical protein